MKIGILGGTFNPIHIAHIKIAEAALSELNLDEVWIMPAGDPPHKDEIGGAGRFTRYEMCRIAALDHECIIAKDIELYKSGAAYTYETIAGLRRIYPDYEFTFIMGEDSLRSFDIWVHPEIVCKNADIAVAIRSDENTVWGTFEKDKSGVIVERGDAIKASSGETIQAIAQKLSKKYGGRFSILDCPFDDISSSRLRELIYAHDEKSLKEARGMLPEGVFDYISSHKLYAACMPHNPEKFEEIRKELKHSLKPKRFYHTLGVSDTCVALAAKHGYPIEEARYAGLLHDCAKGMSGEELLKFAKKKSLPISDIEYEVPELLHAKVGAYLALHKYKIKDPDVLHAIEVHTTGCKGMSVLDEIVYIADYIEPSRDAAPRLFEIRQMAFNDLDAAFMMILYDTVEYLKVCGKAVDEVTQEVYEYYSIQNSMRRHSEN